MCSPSNGARPDPDPVARCDAAHRSYVAQHRELLEAISAVDASELWRRDGAASVVAWVSARYEEPHSTAKHWVEQARALAARPALAEAYGDSRVSQGQMQALTVLTRPQTDDDELWLEQLRNWNIAELQREARRARARELERRDGGRYVSMRWTKDERFLRVEGQLHPEEGSALMKAVDRAVPADVSWTAVDRHRADGLVALARATVAADADPDRATVVVHVEEGTLRGDVDADTIASLDTGGSVGRDTALRLSCDARVETVSYDASRRPVGIDRASRIVPAWMYRQLRHRDQGCVFPGCGRRRFAQAHHIVHWARGGRTDLDNLVLTCTDHHELLHEHRWSLRGEAGPSIGWIRPDGTLFEPRAPALAPALAGAYDDTS